MKAYLCLSLLALGLVACDKPIDDGHIIPAGTLGEKADPQKTPQVSKTDITTTDGDPMTTDTTSTTGCESECGQASDCPTYGQPCVTTKCLGPVTCKHCSAIPLAAPWSYCFDNGPADACCLASNSTCDSGCGVSSCTGGYGNCDGKASTGCEKYVGADNSCTCSAFNCPALPGISSGSCSGGTTCAITCDSTHANCDGNPNNGCEINLNSATDCRVSGCSTGTNCTTLGSSSASTCSGGVCTVVCDSGHLNCDGLASNGCEVDLAAIGTCGTACNDLKNCKQSQVTTATCTSGVCGITTCNGTYANCDGDYSNGCEVDLSSTGSCGTTCGNKIDCTALKNVGTVTCSSTRACGISTCSSGKADCDTTVSNGCEIDTTKDAAHCGSCTTVCSTQNVTGGVATCASSACTSSCKTNFADCNSNLQTDACESSLQSDVNNCNGCAMKCSTANIAATCASGGCETGVCTNGYADCNGNKRSDGCEINLNTDPSNCGACKSVCSGNNVPTLACAAGKCSGACKTGTADCDNNKLTNGCEINIQGDADNCGGCTMPCSNNHMDTRTCTAGMCNGACATGFGDCNNNKRGDGCEIDLTSTVTACGACNVDCTATEVHVATEAKSCDTSKCTYSGECDVGWGDCDTDKANGCEVSLLTSKDHCGTCDTVCTAPTDGTAVCTAGKCDFTCSAGLLKCADSCAKCCDDSDCRSPPDPSDKCIVGKCTAGMCAYKPKSCVTTDCFSGVQCNSTTGECKGTPLTGNSCGQAGCCEIGGTCSDGECNCVDNKGKDCTTGLGACEKGLCSSGGACDKETLPNGTMCSDTDKCKLDTMCSNGSCVGEDKICTPSGPCKTSSCTTATGNCDEGTAPEGLPCSSKNSCVQNEACNATGECQGTILPDATPCTNDTCTATSIKSCLSGVCNCVEPMDMSAAVSADLSISTPVADLGVDMSIGRPPHGCSTIPADALPSTLSLVFVVAALLRRGRRRG